MILIPLIDDIFLVMAAYLLMMHAMSFAPLAFLA